MGFLSKSNPWNFTLWQFSCARRVDTNYTLCVVHQWPGVQRISAHFCFCLSVMLEFVIGNDFFCRIYRTTSCFCRAWTKFVHLYFLTILFLDINLSIFPNILLSRLHNNFVQFCYDVVQNMIFGYFPNAQRYNDNLNLILNFSEILFPTKNGGKQYARHRSVCVIVLLVESIKF